MNTVAHAVIPKAMKMDLLDLPGNADFCGRNDMSACFECKGTWI